VSGKVWTSDQLISSTRQRCFNVASSDDFADADVLQILNEVVDEYLVPVIIRGRRNHFVRAVTATMPVSGRVRVPAACTDATLRAITLTIGGVNYPVTEVDLESGILATNSSATTFLAGIRYFFEGDYLVFVPPSAIPLGSTVNVYFYARPPLLVLPSASAAITAFPGGAAPGFYRVTTSVPSTMTGTFQGDVTGGQSSFQRYQENVAITVVNATTLDIPVDPATGLQPSELTVGDFVNLTGEAPVVTGCPADFTRLLCQAAAYRIVAAKGYDKKLAEVEKILLRMEASASVGLRRRNVGDRPALAAYPERIGINPFYLV